MICKVIFVICTCFRQCCRLLSSCGCLLQTLQQVAQFVWVPDSNTAASCSVRVGTCFKHGCKLLSSCGYLLQMLQQVAQFGWVCLIQTLLHVAQSVWVPASNTAAGCSVPVGTCFKRCSKLLSTCGYLLQTQLQDAQFLLHRWHFGSHRLSYGICVCQICDIVCIHNPA